ncbi:ULP_PROTEASE domain-containing protein [Meloidogyne graminicola]|uniref:Small ribosomal subunit protein bS16m n=1 Tax=Meloidogyne graminicola TaxID=189291 RepID=A0A8T0A4H8_9BILA|nr:ULP_PROTEASE domain-containing protein [Meloidogyne graminicola]
MRLLSYEDIIIHDEDAITFHGHGWLTDNIVNFAIICIVYATQCELIKYETNHIDDLLKNIGINSKKWNIFIYNNSNNPDQVYSGSHWSLLLFNPNKRNFLLFDPAKMANKTYIDEPIYSFVSKMKNYLNISSNEAISRYCQFPFMEVSGDCGIYIIEYARIIFKHICVDYYVNPDFLKFDGYLKEGLVGVEKVREEWKRLFFLCFLALMRQLVNPALFGRPYVYLAPFGCNDRLVYHIAVYPDKALGQHYRGNMIEDLGTFDPLPNDKNEKVVSIKYDRLKYWLGVRNAEVSVPLLELLGLSGLLPLHPNTFTRARTHRRLIYKAFEKRNENKNIEENLKNEEKS